MRSRRGNFVFGCFYLVVGALQFPLLVDSNPIAMWVVSSICFLGAGMKFYMAVKG